jgi:hypothetical protein
LWAHPAHVDGIWYLARNAPWHIVAVLFLDRCAADVQLAGETALWQHPKLEAALNQLNVGLLP